jgi:glycosyltransferase involved in cell wall biosynthesis
VPDTAKQPVVSVVTPVFNGAAFIAENVELIRSEFGSSGISYELIVVSDGSVDETVEQAVAAGHPEVRVFHYDRNLGKGYAVKLGLLAARGRYAGFIDSDLDLHPSELPKFLEAMETEGLDAAIGSKRHPHSQVDYPLRRRVYSWLYQQLIRVLFQLHVRDTQVGIKLFRRELVDAVAPHLLVKRYAFDLELLAVAAGSGFRRIEELPVQLRYGFQGSTGMSPLAIAQALWDTAAIFYRLRILRYYSRRRLVVGDRRAAPPLRCTVAIIGRSSTEGLDATLSALGRMERPPEVVSTELAAPRREGDDITARRLQALQQSDTDLIAFFQPGTVPATNWLGALLPYFANPHVVAVGGPILPATAGGLRVGATAAVYESRFAAGPVARRHVPGNLRETQDQPLQNLLVRRDTALATDAFGQAARHQDDGDLCRQLGRGSSVLFTPEAPVLAPMPTLVRPLLRTLHSHGRARGRSLGTGRGAPLSAAAPAAFALAALLAPGYARLPRSARRAGLVLGAAYAVGLVYASGHAAFRHRSLRVGLAFALAAPASHLAYGAGALRGLGESLLTRRAPDSEPASAERLLSHNSDEGGMPKVPSGDPLRER